MASNEVEIEDAQKELKRKERILRLSAKTEKPPNYCEICDRTFKNLHGLSIHNSMSHKGKRFQGTKFEELEQELARLKNGITHPLIINKPNDDALLNEIVELTERLNLSREQILVLLKLKLKKVRDNDV